MADRELLIAIEKLRREICEGSELCLDKIARLDTLYQVLLAECWKLHERRGPCEAELGGDYE